MRQMRTVLTQLNPPSLRTKTLAAAAAEYCAVFSERTEIRVLFEVGDSSVRLSDDQSTTLYRLLQEGLTNVARHSSASCAWVSLSAEDGEATMSVEDNGVGFDSNAVDGTGLMGIRDRFAMLDGHVEVLATPGRGVRIEGSLPLKSPSNVAGARR